MSKTGSNSSTQGFSDFLQKANNLKIAVKGTIVVAIPMIVSVFLLFKMWDLLHQTEQQVNRESKSKQIFSQCNNLYQIMLDATSSASTYTLTKQEKFRDDFQKARSATDDCYKVLDRLLAGQPSRQKALNDMKSVEGDLFRCFQTMMDITSEGEIDNEFITLLTLRSHTQSLIRELHKEIAAFRDAENEYAKGAEAAARKREEQKQLLIMMTVVLDIFTIVTAAFFSNTITQRLNTVQQNALLLAAGEPLHSASSGDDEVGRLDHIFHQMAKSLQQATLRERALIDNALDVICSIDTGNRFIEVNSAAKEAWGFSPDNLMGKRFLEIIAKDDLETTLDALKKLSNAEQPVANLENRIVKADGTIMHALWSLHWSPEQKTYFCVVHDVTARHEIEQMKRDFVSMVSHDLRSPLTSLQGTLSLLDTGKYGELNEKGLAMMHRADFEMGRLIRLIDELLDLEKMQSGKMQLERNTIDMQTVVERSTSAVSYLLEKNGIKLDTPDESLEAFADGPKIVQVVINLLSNAIKFSPANSTITINYEEVDDFVEVRVCDQGRGIPQSQLESVFDRFQQVEAKDHSEKGGKGLGLAICKAIVEAHGGTIHVESQEGEGSTFIFTIPQLN